jgi:signal transduction histidine kinase
MITDERVLARARVFLSATSFVAIYLDPTEPSRYVAVAYGLLLLYVAGSIGLVVALRTARGWPTWAPLLTHLVDICWLAMIAAVTGASSILLLPFLTFVLVSAAYRWGFTGTITTTAAVCLVLFAEAFGFGQNQFIIRAAYTGIAGVLLAYFASYQEQLQLESKTVARLLSRLQPETGMDSALEIVAHELLATFGAQSVAIGVRGADTGHASVWILSSGDELAFRRLPLTTSDMQSYLFDANAAFTLTKRRDGPYVTTAIDATGAATSSHTAAVDAPPIAFASAIAATMSSDEEWFGRVFLFEPPRRHRGVTGLRLLQRITNSITPALRSLYETGRLQSRAEAAERARIARDLHDTSIQSLIGVEMELLALSRRAGDATLRTALADIQFRLRSEIRALRYLLSPPENTSVDATALTQRLTETLAQFQIESGIRARFVSVGAVAVPPSLGRELLLLVHAALSNVRRHSAATCVDVALERDGNGWLLIIEDDGSGFTDGSRFRDRKAAAAPWSIRERVSAMGGQLVVERRQGAQGVRLEVRLPPLVTPA